MSTPSSSQARLPASVGAPSSAAVGVVKSTAACTVKTCERERLYNLIYKLGMQKVARDHGALIEKGKKEGWVGQKFFVKNHSGVWKQAGENKKRKRPTVDEYLKESKKRKEAISKQLVVFKAKVAELELEIELQDAAQQILKLKAAVARKQ